jgi:hypothetical protein
MFPAAKAMTAYLLSSFAALPFTTKLSSGTVDDPMNAAAPGFAESQAWIPPMA